MEAQTDKTNWLERPLFSTVPALTYEVLLFALIMLAAVASRFYNLGARVMSHDESLHTYFSWLLYKGDGYQHNPMMHGPLQFHLIALSYFLFGASDFTARIPAAIFNIATIALTWNWRRYLGKTGGLIAGFLMLISPIMLFYGRYVREDPYAIFSGVLMLYVVLRYLEGGQKRYLYLLAVSLMLHFIDKETSFIYTAALLLFLAIYFIFRVTRRTWDDARSYRVFIIALIVGVLLLGAGTAISLGGQAASHARFNRGSATGKSVGDSLAAATHGRRHLRHRFGGDRTLSDRGSRLLPDPRLYVGTREDRAFVRHAATNRHAGAPDADPLPHQAVGEPAQHPDPDNGCRCAGSDQPERAGSWHLHRDQLSPSPLQWACFGTGTGGNTRSPSGCPSRSSTQRSLRTRTVSLQAWLDRWVTGWHNRACKEAANPGITTSW